MLFTEKLTPPKLLPRMPTMKSKPIPNAIDKHAKTTIKKKVDMRIQHLLTNAIQQHHRSFLVMVGEHGMDQIMHLHFFLTNHWIKRPSVLWCYKKDLGFSSNRKKRMKYLQTLAKKGLRDQDTSNPFDAFISTTDIRYCYYKETQNILGNTYGMLVLQDFEAITPNILARTMECIQGGGLIVILLKSGNSLKQLHSLTMDVHARFKTSQFDTVIPRFNERFIMSLMDCENCLVIDDELTVLPVSQNKHISSTNSNVTAMTSLLEVEDTPQLALLKQEHSDDEILFDLLKKAKTTDQASALVKIGSMLKSGNLASILALTASRGRGKSAALGLGLASAIAHGYSNIFVTSPSPENLQTFFEFVFIGLEQLGYKQHADYDYSSNSNKHITRINIFKNHRQTVQYINPEDHAILQQCELLIIDEAAAIPLNKIKKLLNTQHMTWLSSTVNGYEGTGRSLSLKLLGELKESKSTVFIESELIEPIRYHDNDPIEVWLNELLCLNAQPGPSINQLPCPQQCQLYVVNRDTLFSHHKVSEVFLNRLVGLFVTSHYKNQPNDLQLMSDAPAHRLFVLIPPTSPNSLPNPLVVIQVCIEGKTNNSYTHGDLIPHVLAQQFQSDDFMSLNGVRIVRIATHPSFQRMGYGKYAVEQLIKYYHNELYTESSMASLKERGDVDYVAQSDNVLAPMLSPLDSSVPPQLAYLGVSFGLTTDLYKFWNKLDFKMVYIRQSMNDMTGEHTAIMLRNNDKCEDFIRDFQSSLLDRFMVLLSYDFKSFPLDLSIMVLKGLKQFEMALVDESSIVHHYSIASIKRLKYFTMNIVDYHVILDLFPKIAHDVNLELIKNENGVLQLSGVLKSILLGIGLQRKQIHEISQEMKIPNSQVLALLTKGVKRVYSSLEELLKVSMDNVLDVKHLNAPAEHVPLAIEPEITIDEELEMEASEMQKESLLRLNLEDYKIESGDLEGVVGLEGIVAVPSKKRKMLQKGLKKKQKQ
eukprot:NODE_147_length_17537_cov_0.265627.p1 type:complete len:987 gc:universal NODE_147_length_17537_cov_0.265627:14855-11895(-)